MNSNVLPGFWRPSTLVLLGAGLLATDPLRWLYGTWTDAAYNAEGAAVAAVVALLALWSYTSARVPDAPGSQRYAMGLLMASAGVRAVGQLLRVNVIGAATLAIDVYALSILAGLHQRERALSPGWLAVLFAFSLPLERVVQRVLGYGLQEISAGGACGLLSLLDGGVQCIGTRILLAGQDLLVDLPCAGSRGLMLALMLLAAVAALRRPSLGQAAFGVVIAIASALAANTVRIAALALGLAYAPGVDWMGAPWHELLGVAAFAVSAIPVLWWARRVVPRVPKRSFVRPRPMRWSRAAAFAATSAIIVSLPAHPVDVVRETPPPQLPSHLDTFDARVQPLNAMERAYFAQYGGGAARAQYGPHSLLLVSTAAPLRHLHAPDECLRGAGHEVRYVGLAHGGLPSAIYSSIDPDGHRWRVAVSYVSSRGQGAASIAHAVWLWLRDPGGRWTMVQRVTPWATPSIDAARFDAAVLRALDLPAAEPHSLHLAPVI